MRSWLTIDLQVLSSYRQILTLGSASWLFIEGDVVAVHNKDEDTVYFPDLPFTRAAVKQINEFQRLAMHARVPESDFDYYVASSGMRALRSVLARPAEQINTQPEEKNNDKVGR